MHNSRAGIGAGGFTHLSVPEGKQLDKADSKHATTDSGDSGFLSGENLSSDHFTSSPELQKIQEEPAFPPAVNRQKQASLQEEDSQTLDSGVELDSCHQQQQQQRGTMRVDNLNDLCEEMTGLKVNRETPREAPLAPQKWEACFVQNDDGDTFLHRAVIHEIPDAAITLIRLAPRPCLDIQNDHGRTALHLAALTNQPLIVRQMVAAGANTSIRDYEGNTSLHLACMYDRPECVKALLTPLSAYELQQSSPAAQAAIAIPQDLEQWNYDGKRCVHLATETSNVEILQYLVRAGADINSREGKAGYTPLHMAIETNNMTVLSFLLSDCPTIRLEQVTYAGLTGYQLAAIRQNSSLLEVLSIRGAEPLSPPESDYDDEDDSEEDDQIPPYYGPNAFGSSNPEQKA